RRIIRRAVRHAFLLGGDGLVTPPLVEATVAVMGEAYPDIVKQRELVARTVQREEERFRQTLERGLDMLDDLLAKGDITGDDAFFLHDTLGFPIDLTREIAEERAHRVDLDGFRARMEEQRTRAVEARRANVAATPTEAYRTLVDGGATDFTGRQEYETTGANVLGLLVDGNRVNSATEGDVEVVLNRTPFYAESGGQVGDTGVITTANGAFVRIIDTQYGLPELVVHIGQIEAGSITEGDEVTASIDGDRRDRIRRNHTATHVLHWALREVLGSHVQQAGSHVAPDRLRFDFSHFEAVTPEQLDDIEARANAEVISDARVRHYETTKDHAESIGAIAFFGDKYGDLVRVLEAGEHSIELCGGTHVHALGFIGPIKIVSEGSIGANLRRIEAFTGDGALAYIHSEEVVLRDTAARLSVAPAEVGDRVDKLLSEIKALRGELDAQRRESARSEAGSLAAAAVDGIVVERRDGFSNDDLRSLALATRDALGSGIVGLVGITPDGKAAVAVAVSKDLVERGITAGDVAAETAKVLGGGTGRGADVVAGGGPNAAAIDEARAVLVQNVKENAAKAAGTK
ncbi:MAG: alanine--tRNA ligase, partial [Acidimicrobiia bacterium]|nr:alanine--tRNA ligase [Acidimicrobiia bacterium]